MNGKLDSATLRATLVGAAILTGCSCQTAGRAHPEARIELIARATIPGDARDLSGLSDALAIGGPADALGGFGSAIDWSGKADRYVTAVDRGPADGATNFPNRLEWFDLRLDTQSPGGLAAILVATTLLVDETGRQLVGDVGAFVRDNPARGLRFDPEGVRIGRTGSVCVADEYSP